MENQYYWRAFIEKNGQPSYLGAKANAINHLFDLQDGYDVQNCALFTEEDMELLVLQNKVTEEHKGLKFETALDAMLDTDSNRLVLILYPTVEDCQKVVEQSMRNLKKHFTSFFFAGNVLAKKDDNELALLLQIQSHSYGRNEQENRIAFANILAKSLENMDDAMYNIFLQMVVREGQRREKSRIITAPSQMDIR